MKYYRRKERNPDTYYSKPQPCWTCKNCYGGCEWSRDFQPVPGWIAEKTVINNDGETLESYKIIKCPKYTKER